MTIAVLQVKYWVRADLPHTDRGAQSRAVSSRRPYPGRLRGSFLSCWIDSVAKKPRVLLCHALSAHGLAGTHGDAGARPPVGIGDVDWHGITAL
jgi:hypothetical protein